MAASTLGTAFVFPASIAFWTGEFLATRRCTLALKSRCLCHADASDRRTVHWMMKRCFSNFALITLVVDVTAHAMQQYIKTWNTTPLTKSGKEYYHNITIVLNFIMNRGNSRKFLI